MQFMHNVVMIYIDFTLKTFIIKPSLKTENWFQKHIFITQYYSYEL